MGLYQYMLNFVSLINQKDQELVMFKESSYKAHIRAWNLKGKSPFQEWVANALCVLQMGENNLLS